MRAVLLFCASLLLICAAIGPSAATAADAVYSLDLTDFAGGSVPQWLRAKGFVPQRDANNAARINLSFADKSLVLQTKRRALGLLLNEVNVAGSSRVNIEWGVDVFPPGASYERGVRSEAVMIYLFFGNKKLSSGSLLIPDSPYFIGLFLCDSDRIDHPFKGSYFHAGGRYVCIHHASVGTPVTSDYPIAEAFSRFFGPREVPDISGIGIAIDTDSAKGNGVAQSFVRKIEFLK